MRIKPETRKAMDNLIHAARTDAHHDVPESRSELHGAMDEMVSAIVREVQQRLGNPSSRR